jgi:hypothetical protein
MMRMNLLLVSVLLLCSAGLQAAHVLKIKKTVSKKVAKGIKVQYEIY